MRRDDDLVGAEGAERVLDRLQRIAVADLTAGFDPLPAEPRETRVESLLRLRSGLVHIRRERLHRRIERRRDDQDLRRVTRAVLFDALAQGLTADGLVRD